MMKPARARIVAYFSSLTLGGVLFIAIPLILLGAGTAVVIAAAQSPHPDQHLVVPAGVSSPAITRDQPAASSSSSLSSPAPKHLESSSPASSSSSPAAARAPQPAAGSSTSSSSTPQPASSSSVSAPAAVNELLKPAAGLLAGDPPLKTTVGQLGALVPAG